ncbi:MAG: hypothetical protein A2096_11505 [Spirochaetes bacterium GWF1_41_5]|nr:MAG: hypothetical protein A2096_11505 [Spirochaetes bacterium GWF1_41_5]
MPTNRRRIFNIDEANIKLDKAMKIILNDNEKIANLAACFKQERVKLGLSQCALAKKAGINSRIISRIDEVPYLV